MISDRCLGKGSVRMIVMTAWVTDDVVTIILDHHGLKAIGVTIRDAAVHATIAYLSTSGT